jgi:hypothetical protein
LEQMSRVTETWYSLQPQLGLGVLVDAFINVR